MQTDLVPRQRPTISIGDSACFTKTITEADVVGFADASGDRNPLHLDEDYASRTRFGRRVAHGVLSAGMISAVLGNNLPGLGTIFVELSVRFVRPVFLGDTVTARAEVSEIAGPKRVRLLVSCANQRGEEVTVGHAVVVPPPGTRLEGHDADAAVRGE